MKELIDYILQFGNLNKEQTDFIWSKAELLELSKNDYFSEAGKIMVKESPIILLMKIILSPIINGLKQK